MCIFCLFVLGADFNHFVKSTGHGMKQFIMLRFGEQERIGLQVKFEFVWMPRKISIKKGIKNKIFFISFRFNKEAKISAIQSWTCIVSFNSFAMSVCFFTYVNCY